MRPVLPPDGPPNVKDGDSPTGGVPGTMFAACYGTRTAHPWPALDPDEDPAPDQDYYSMFVSRSDAMGWLDSEDEFGLWGMNDAGGRRPGESSAGGHLDAWFQVEANPVTRDRPLPVQPFLRCALDVCNQFDIVELTSALLLLPVQRLGPRRAGAAASMRTARWFGNLDPALRVSVEVGLAVGQSAPVGALDAAVSDFYNLSQSVFRNPAAGDGGSSLRPPFDDEFWDGPVAASATMSGELAEWGPESIGWVAQVLAECAAAAGLTSPLLLSVTRQRTPVG